MANALYDTFKQGVLDKLFDMNSDIIKAALIDSADYTFGAAHDEFAGASRDVALVAVVADSPTLTAPTITNGVFDTADFVWTAVTGDPSEAIILRDASITNERLVAFYDTGMTGMPVTPNGGNINLTVHASGWFAL
jgi:hypothetical protein